MDLTQPGRTAATSSSVVSAAGRWISPGGGRVSSNGSNNYIGIYSGSTGTAAVDGVGSVWTSNGNLFVGYDGIATLTITNGGRVSVAGNADH